MLDAYLSRRASRPIRTRSADLADQVHYGPDSDKTHRDVNSLADLHQWMQVGATCLTGSFSRLILPICAMHGALYGSFSSDSISRFACRLFFLLFFFLLLPFSPCFLAVVWFGTPLFWLLMPPSLPSSSLLLSGRMVFTPAFVEFHFWCGSGRTERAAQW